MNSIKSYVYKVNMIDFNIVFVNWRWKSTVD